MKFFSRVKDFFLALKNALTAKTSKEKNHHEEEAEEFEAMPEQSPRPPRIQEEKKNSSKVYGVKKRAILFIICAFAAIYLFGFLLGGSDKEVAQIPNKGETASPRNEMNILPNYEQIMSANQAVQDKKSNPLPENPANNIPEDEQITPNLNPEYGLPPANYNSVPTLPNTGYYAPQFVDPAKTVAVTQQEDYRKSPIGFNVAFKAPATNTSSADMPEGQKQTDGLADVQAKVNTATSISYSQPELYTLQQGAIIPVTLVTGIDSDLPGQIICQVRQNVYDSVSGNYLLIPQGTKILGEVKGGAPKAGQERIGVVWQRMILPNGISVELGGMDGVDTSGYSGLKDKVDNHSGKIIGATLISSLLAAGAQIASGNVGDTSNMSTGQLAVSGAATNVMNAGAKMVEKNININPTIKIRPGIQFNVFVNKDIVLRPYR